MGTVAGPQAKRRLSGQGGEILTMVRWTNKAIRNLLENSMEKDDHAIAATEWEFTGEVIDHFVPNQTCQLCESRNLRYHFEILSKSRSDASLLVGSSCIKKFDIAVFDENGEEVLGNRKSSFLQKKIEEKRHLAEENGQRERSTRDEAKPTDLASVRSLVFPERAHSAGIFGDHLDGDDPTHHSPEPRSERKEYRPFQLPEYVTCSICGEYTKEWVSFNPNQCRKCLDRLHKNR